MLHTEGLEGEKLAIQLVEVVDPADYLFTAAGYRLQEGERSVVVHTELTNRGAVAFQSLPDLYLVLVTPDGKTISKAPVSLSSRPPHRIGVPPGETAGGHTVYVVPEQTEITSVRWSPAPRRGVAHPELDGRGLRHPVPMGPLLRKLVELVLPWLVEERVSRWVVYALYAATTAVIWYAFVLQNPVAGWFVVIPPVLLAAWTRVRGLAKVNMVLFVVALATTLVPAYFLGEFQSAAHIPVGPRLFAYLLFLLWVAAYPPVLDHLDRDKRRQGAGPAGPDEAAGRPGAGGQAVAGDGRDAGGGRDVSRRRSAWGRWRSGAGRPRCSRVSPAWCSRCCPSPTAGWGGTPTCWTSPPRCSPPTSGGPRS